MTTNITEEHRRAFQTLMSGDYDYFAPFSSHVNGEPAAAIVATTGHEPDNHHAETGYQIAPIFVSIPKFMVLTDHDGHEA